MRLLMISIGQDILREGSVTQMRHFKYGKICDSLDIVVLHTKRHICLHRQETEHHARLRQSEADETARTGKKIPLAPFIKGGNNGNVRIYASGGKNKIISFFRACALAGRIAKEHKIDLITTQDAGYAGLIGYCLKKKFKVKLNVQIHGQEEKLFNKILLFPFRKKIIKNADSVRVVSEWLKRWVMKKYRVRAEKIFKIPIYSQEKKLRNLEIKKLDPVDERRASIRNYLPAEVSTCACLNADRLMRIRELGDADINGGIFTILTVGRLVKVKNIKLQIEALADVVKIFPDVKLIIVGDGTEKENLQKLASKLKLDDSVEFAGWQKDLAPYYENADLFLLTSNNEGWGMVVIEAMSAGCPVIMTDVGCAGEIVKNEENGIVIHIGDKKALIAAISEMITNKEKRAMFAEKGVKAVNILPNGEETLKMYGEMWNL